jgi:NAD(P)-dependent dehydrogenase (short-subunit alcohol dehydrogenase family)
MNRDSPSALITGASSGIGQSTATRLAGNGWRVFAGVRDPAGAQLGGAEVVELDVTSADSIARALEHVRAQTGGRLDALVNNAGIPVAGAMETVPVADFRALIETNLIGSFAVTKAFLPLVRQARGRVVFVGSLGGRVAFPYASAYHASKFGIEGLAESLRAEMLPLGVSVSVVEPGAMATEIWGKGREQLSAVRAGLTPEQREVYGEALDGFDQTLASADEDGEDPSEVAGTIENALTDTNPNDRYLVGRGARALTLLEPLLPSGLFDRVKRRAAGAS